MAEKVTISRISHFDKDKNGAQLTSKTGKPYSRCLIDLVDGRKVSGFGSAKTNTWNAGAEVEIEITQSGEYLNFSVPKVELGGFTEMDRETLNRIGQRVMSIESNVALLVRMASGEKPQTVNNSTYKQQSSTYPEYKGEPDFTLKEKDVPF